MFLYSEKKVKEILDNSDEIKDIFDDSGHTDFRCPLDKLIIGSERFPTKEFTQLIAPARFRLANRGKRSKYTLKYDKFDVKWMPFNPQSAKTTIMVNPYKHRLGPAQILRLIKFVLGEYHDAVVITNDDKIDLIRHMTTYFNPKELEKRLYIGYQRQPTNNYKNMDKTYYHNGRKGQQIKNYNKGEEQGIEDIDWTRLEKTRKRRYNTDRPTILDFLLNSRDDILKHIVVVDIDRFSGRDKIMRRIKKYGSFMKAYKDLTVLERKKVRKSMAFLEPSIDLLKLYNDDLMQWLKTSPLIYMLHTCKGALDVWSQVKVKKLDRMMFSPIEMVNGLPPMNEYLIHCVTKYKIDNWKTALELHE